MLKGFNRRVVVMKNPDSKMFDEAFFVVKENAVFNKREKSPVERAKEIIKDLEEESLYGKRKKRLSEPLKALIFMVIGAVIGAFLGYF